MQLKHNISLKGYTTLGIGGKARNLFNIQSADDLCQIREDFGGDFYLLGAGSNLLIKDSTITKPIIKLGKEFDYLKEDGELLEAGAAVRFSSLLGYCLKNKLQGFEQLAGIPASLGGMLAMNAAAFGGGISSHLVKAEIFTSGAIRQVRKEDLAFDYRFSSLKGTVILRAWFSLEKASRPKNLKAAVNDFLGQRKKTQPYPSEGNPKIFTCGCIFKNPPKFSAGRLIEGCGLKGLEKGDAYVSRKHANFIINAKNATYNDVDYLISKIKERVQSNYSLILEEEIERWK